MISRNIAERPLNLTSILKRFKSFIKLLYQEKGTQSIEKKKDENNYFTAETNQKEERVHTLKKGKQIQI